MFVVILFLLAVGLGSYGASFFSSWIARQWHAVDVPSGGRKIHTHPIPLLGGLGLFFVIAIGFWLQHNSISGFQIAGILIAMGMVTVIGILDDRYDLPATWRLLGYILASIVVVATGTGVVQITRWIGHGGFSLVWWQWGNIAMPADMLTVVWLVVVMFATKFMDGIDGLVVGQTTIGALMIAALTLTPAYYQPSVAVLALIVAAAFLGFLPRNFFPAKQFLGESGSVLAGFLIAILAILSSAKVAIALAVLTIPIVDILIVFAGRWRRGVPLTQGDTTHLHFRLLHAGMSQRSVAFLVWGVSAFAGIAALGLQTRGKIFLILALAIGTVLTSWIAKLFERR